MNNVSSVEQIVVKPGDIFVNSWGYDQTNVSFAKVVEVTKSGKSAKLVSIGQKQVKQTSDMTETVIPDPENQTSQEAKTYRIILWHDKVLLGQYQKWDGNPCFQSHYA